jgi:hypothetical protein
MTMEREIAIETGPGIVIVCQAVEDIKRFGPRSRLACPGVTVKRV